MFCTDHVYIVGFMIIMTKTHSCIISITEFLNSYTLRLFFTLNAWTPKTPQTADQVQTAKESCRPRSDCSNGAV